ncbi:MAG: hypothetical protein ACRD5Z_11055, partial [Bryobacteraceae bacterium]
MTSRYLADRASFLERKLWFNSQDIDPVNPVYHPGEGDPPFLTEDTFFADAASGYGIAQGFQPTSPFPNIHRYYFGADGTDFSSGGAFEDHLYGGAGIDFLVGAEGNDYLEGNDGTDIYQYNGSSAFGNPSNDGADEILDADGLGIIRYSYQPGAFEATKSTLVGGVGLKVTDTQWESADGKYTFEQQGADMVVTINGDAGGGMRILNFDLDRAQADGYLGIRLADALPEAPQSPVRTFFGDKADWDSDPNQDGVQTQLDAYGNVMRADGEPPRPDIAEPDRQDFFYGGSADEVESFQTAGGDDAVFADGPDSAT